MDNESTSVKRFFETHRIILSDVWLESCIQWCKEENLQPGYSLRDLQTQVYAQWLLLDLRDVEVPVLPANLSSKKHHVLEGDFTLQLMQVVDISKPKLWQLQKIRNTNLLTRSIQQDSDVAGSGKRMLQLTLTDGVQEVEAMEYRPIACLSVNMKPGSKIRLNGPVTIRRGRIMLAEQSHVKLLGGEVEELLVPHAAENVLARVLNVALNPNPRIIEEKLLTVDQHENETTQGYTKIESFIKPQPPSNGRTAVNTATSNNTSNLNQAVTNTNSNSRPRTGTNADLEEMEIDEEIEMLLEAEESLRLQETPKNPSISSTSAYSSSGQRPAESTTIFEDMTFNPEDFDRMDRVISSTQINISNTTKKVAGNYHQGPSTSSSRGTVGSKKSEPKCSSKSPYQAGQSAAATAAAMQGPRKNSKDDPSKSLDIMDDDDIFSDINIDAHLDEIDQRMEQQQQQQVETGLPEVKITTVARLLQMKDNVSRGVFKIKAKFKAIVQKLTIGDDEYKLVMKVEDETGSIDVRLHSDIVSDYAGYFPAAIQSLKNSIAEQDKSAVQKVMIALNQVKNKVLKLDNVMEVQIIKNETFPTVINIL